MRGPVAYASLLNQMTKPEDIWLRCVTARAEAVGRFRNTISEIGSVVVIPFSATSLAVLLVNTGIRCWLIHSVQRQQAIIDFQGEC